MATFMWAQRLISSAASRLTKKGQVQSTKAYGPVKLRSYVAVETETKARELEKYFKSGSGKAIALKRFL
jgi:predicted GIY-YIG superfamily endonuclease